MKTDRISVLITGLAGARLGMQILKALKLSNLPYCFIGTDITQTSYGLSLVDKAYVVPLANHPDYIERLVDICKKNEVKVLFCSSDQEIKTVSKNRKIFDDMGIFLPINPPEVIELCMNKYETMKFLQGKKFNVPKTFLISSPQNIEDIDGYPVVCKPHVGGGGSNNVFIAQDRKELRLLSEYLLNYFQEFLVQEYIGTPDCEYSVGVLLDKEGDLIDSIALKRNILLGLSNRIKMVNKTARKELGEILAISSGISQGRIGRFREVTEYCEEVARVIGAQGPINFKCRLFNKNVSIFEINPRFSGTTSLRALAGFNEPDILIRKYILGEKIDRISYKEGLILRGLNEKFADSYFPNG